MDGDLKLLVELKDENDAMRAILANSPSIPCVYCGAETMAKCPRGFPGCAQADDLLVSGDEHMRRALDALRARAETAHARAAALEEALAERDELLYRLKTSALRGLGGTPGYWIGEIDAALASGLPVQEPS